MSRDAVVITHGTLQEGHVLVRGVFRQQALYVLLPRQENVQIVGRGPDDARMEHGVDIVGAALERGGPQALVQQGTQDAAEQGCLAAAALCRRQ